MGLLLWKHFSQQWDVLSALILSMVALGAAGSHSQCLHYQFSIASTGEINQPGKNRFICKHGTCRLDLAYSGTNLQGANHHYESQLVIIYNIAIFVMQLVPGRVLWSHAESVQQNHLSPDFAWAMSPSSISDKKCGELFNHMLHYGCWEGMTQNRVK